MDDPKPFAVVEEEDKALTVIPTKWIINDNLFAYPKPVKNRSVNQMVMMRKDFENNDNWTRHSYVNVKTYNTFYLADKAARKAEKMDIPLESNVETDYESRRVVNAPKRFCQDSGSEFDPNEAEEEQSDRESIEGMEPGGSEDEEEPPKKRHKLVEGAKKGKKEKRKERKKQKNILHPNEDLVRQKLMKLKDSMSHSGSILKERNERQKKDENFDDPCKSRHNFITSTNGKATSKSQPVTMISSTPRPTIRSSTASNARKHLSFNFDEATESLHLNSSLTSTVKENQLDVLAPKSPSKDKSPSKIIHHSFINSPLMESPTVTNFISINTPTHGSFMTGPSETRRLQSACATPKQANCEDKSHGSDQGRNLEPGLVTIPGDSATDKILEVVLYIKRTVDGIKHHYSRIVQKLFPEESRLGRPSGLPKLPIADPDGFHEYERYLENDLHFGVIYDTMTKFISDADDENEASVVLLQRWISGPCSKCVSWKGTHGNKIPFVSSRLLEAMQCALIKRFGDDIQMKKAIATMQRWFNTSSNRNT